MDTIQRIAKNTGVLLSSQIVSYILGFLYVMYTVRYLGAEGFGILSFALAFTSILGVFADLGLSTLTVREVARDKSLTGKYLGNIAVIKVILVVVTYGLITLVINLLGYPELTIKVVYFIALSVVFNSFTNMFYSIFQAYEKMEYRSLGQILNSVLLLFGALIAISQGYSVIWFACTYFFVSFLLFVYTFFISIWKFITPKLEINLNFWKPTVKQALPFFLSAVVDLIAFRIDIVMLSMMKGDKVAGWYSAAYRLMEVLLFIPAAFASSIYPVLSNSYVSSQNFLKFAYQKSFHYLFIIGIPIAIGTTLLADKIILFIYKGDFVHSIITLQILIWTIPIIFLTYMSGTILASINRQSIALQINFLCMIFNVVINLILIPKYSLIGASITTVITSSLALILFYYFLSKNLYKMLEYKYFIKPAIAGVIMGLFIFSFAEINIILLVCTSILIYIGSLILLKTFSKEDLDLFMKIINFKRSDVKV
jgi:O-antigen/teichoic acid export membrane protein